MAFLLLCFPPLITTNFGGISDEGNNSLEFGVLQISQATEYVFYFTELNCSRHKCLHA